MQLLATRVYHDFDPKTGEEYELRDRMYREASGSFVLMVAGEKPGDPEVAKSLSLEGVFEWLRDCPEQIERRVESGSKVYAFCKRRLWGLASSIDIHLRELMRLGCPGCLANIASRVARAL